MRAIERRSVVSLLLFLATAAALASARDATAQTGPYSYYAVSPCRIYDTRGPAAPYQSAAGNGGGVVYSATIRSFVIRGYCGVPTNAAAVSLNLTIVTPTAGAGDLRISPYPGAFPLVATSAYVRNDTIANGAIVPLGTVTTPGTDPDFQILGAGCDVIGGVYTCTSTFTYHFIVDVNGYFQ